MKLTTALCLSLSLAAGFFVYLNALPNQFLWDDEEQIIANQLIQSPANIPKLFLSSTGYMAGSDTTNGFYRPMMFMVYLICYQIGKFTPWVYHFFQLAFHLANITLLFFIFKQILSDLKIKPIKPIALTTTLIFALHPVISEAVIYLGAIGEPLYAFFSLASFLIFLKGINYQKRAIKPFFLFSSLGLAFFGLFAKETAVVVFLLIFAYLLLFVKPKLEKLINYLFSFGALFGFYLLIRLFIARVSFAQPHIVPIAQASLISRLLTIPYEIVTYLSLVFWPEKLLIYRHFVIESPTEIRFLGSISGLIIVGIFLYLLIKRQEKVKQKLLIFSLFWFIFTLLPALNIIPLNMTLAERWLYLPLAGLLFFLNLLILPIIYKLSKTIKIISLIFFLVLITVFFIRTMIRNSNWRSGLALYGHDIKFNQNNANLENNYGVELFRTGNVKEAKDHFKKSVELEPNWAVSRNNLGAVFERENNLEQALNQYQKAVELSSYYLAYQNLPGILLKMDRREEAKRFIEQQALPRFPGNANLYLLLSQIYYQEGQTEISRALTQKAHALK